MSLQQTLVAKGEALYRTGDYGDAETVFSSLPEGAGGERAAAASTKARLLGMCRLRLGDRDGALTLLRHAHELIPGDPLAALHYGFGLHAIGDIETAAGLFSLAEPGLLADPAPPLNLAACLYALGDYPGAEAAARRARLRAPRLAQARYMLGLTRLAQGRVVPAEAEFKIALQLDPRFAEAWLNLGLVAYQANDIFAAKWMMRRALGCAPGHSVATANLAIFMRLTGEVEDAETLLREAHERNPEAAELRVNLAVEYLNEGRSTEALTLLDVPPPLNRAARQHWQIQRSLALIEAGREDEAKAVLDEIGEPLPALRPLLQWRRAMLARAAGERDLACALAEEVEAALNEQVLLEHRLVAHLQLANFWIREGEPTRGFSFWVRGHRLAQRNQPFSRDEERAFTDANIARFNHARMHAGARASNSDPAPVFIVGMPRSGTTLAEQIIGAHQQAYAAGERVSLNRAFHRLGASAHTRGTPGGIAALDASALDAAAEAYLAELHGLARAADVIVDKMPANTRFLGLVGLMLPGARIIHCTRDPRDIGLSIFSRRFFGYHPYSHDLSDLGWTIGEHQRLMNHWGEVLPNSILTLAMQDWIDDFDGTLRRVLTFLDLPYDPACERFYEQDSVVRTASKHQVRQPINARGLGRWKRHAADLAPLITELEAAGLIAAGEGAQVL